MDHLIARNAYLTKLAGLGLVVGIGMNGQSIIFNPTERRKLNFRRHHVDGVAPMIVSTLTGLLGLFPGHRKLRRQAAAGALLAQG